MFNLEQIKAFIFKYQPEGLIVDTNILILFLIGNYDIKFIESYELLNNSNKKYLSSDFDLLKKIFSMFKKLVITPNVITELSNLTITKNGFYGEKLLFYIETVIKFLKSVEERHQKTDCLWGLELKIISKFGLTDLTMFELSKQTKMPILTDELPFYTYAYSNRVPIIKFEHIKNYRFQSVLEL